MCAAEMFTARGVARKGAPAGKRKTTPAEAHRRRQEKRKEDDWVLCPICLCRSWGPGRSSNAVDHIKKGKCPVKLAKIVVTQAASGVTAVRAGFWVHPDGKVTVAALAPGPDRRSKRTYWTPATFATVAEAEMHFDGLLGSATVAAAAGGTTAVQFGDAAVWTLTGADRVKKTPIWEFKTAGRPHTEKDGSVADAAVARPLAVEVDDLPAVADGIPPAGELFGDFGEMVLDEVPAPAPAEAGVDPLAEFLRGLGMEVPAEVDDAAAAVDADFFGDFGELLDDGVGAAAPAPAAEAGVDPLEVLMLGFQVGAPHLPVP